MRLSLCVINTAQKSGGQVDGAALLPYCDSLGKTRKSRRGHSQRIISRCHTFKTHPAGFQTVRTQGKRPCHLASQAYGKIHLFLQHQRSGYSYVHLPGGTCPSHLPQSILRIKDVWCISYGTACLCGTCGKTGLERQDSSQHYRCLFSCFLSHAYTSFPCATSFP